FSLPAIWTAGEEEDVSVRDLCTWMCENPAKFLQLDYSKGRIENGYDADIVVWDPEKEISFDHIYHRHPATPYAGRPMKGEVQHTIVNGKVVFSANRFPDLEAGKI